MLLVRNPRMVYWEGIPRERLMSRQNVSSTHASRWMDNRRNAMRTSRHMDTIAVLMLGKCKSGKTALVNRWVNGVYEDSYTPTVEDFYEKPISFHGQSVSIGVIDMTGSFDFPAMTELFLNRADVVLLVYDVGDEESVKNLSYRYEQVRKVRQHRELYVSIIGTKMDDPSEWSNRSYRNEIVEKIVEEVGPSAKHVLTSARHNWNVDEAFEGALSNMSPSIIPNEDTIERLREMVEKNHQYKCHYRCSIMCSLM